MKKTIKLWKYSGVLLVATGILHTIVAIALFKDYLWSIIKNLLSGTLQGDNLSQGLAFWFFIPQALIILFTKRGSKN